ncbi:MAG: hypothetical protein WCO93_05235 [bacterium]
MEENIFDALPGFDRLLRQKSFDELSGTERDLVLRFITEADYTRFRESVMVASNRRGSGSPAATITPDPSVKNRLMQTFRQDENSVPDTAPGTLLRFLSYRIPLYQAGLAASVLLFLVFYLFLQNYRMTGQVAVADTVYIDKPVLMKDTVWLEKPEAKTPGSARADHHHPGSVSSTPAGQSVPDNPLYARQMQDAMSRMSVISGLGRDKSVTHDAGLMKLVAMGVASTTLP